MKISNKQLAANKENALKGGVKTDNGKEIIKFNSYDHGLTANRLLDEKEKLKYNIALNKLKDEFSIEGYLEEILVERIAFYYIKIQKANEIEEKYSYFEGLINILERRNRLEKNGGVSPILQEAVKKLEDVLEINNIEDLLKIQRYTTTTENRLYKATNELIKIKKIKNQNFKIKSIL